MAAFSKWLKRLPHAEETWTSVLFRGSSVMFYENAMFLSDEAQTLHDSELHRLGHEYTTIINFHTHNQGR